MRGDWVDRDARRGRSRVWAWAGLAVVLGACGAQRNTGLPQAQAESLLTRIVIAQCTRNPRLVETVHTAPADPKAYVYGHLEAVKVYPVEKEITGTCEDHSNLTGNVINRTDFWRVHAKFTTSFYQDAAGNWTHTPVLGTCDGARTAYQMDGGPVVQTPADEATLKPGKGGCSFAERDGS
jgi:hypothetical protein